MLNGQDEPCKECESSISDISEKSPIKVIKTKTASKWGAARKAFLSKNKGESPNRTSPSKEESLDNPT